MNTKKILGFVGSIVLIVGVFAPIISIPIVGNMNYYRNGEGDGIIILILAIISMILLLIEKYVWIWVTGICSLGIIIYSFLNIHAALHKAKEDMKSELSGNIFQGLADMAIQSIQIQWGWVLLIIGSVLLISSAAIKDKI